MPLIYPQPLRPGDTVGIAAPAGPFDHEAFFNGLSVLETMGFRPMQAKDLYLRDGYLAGPDAHRADQLMRLFSEPEVKAIICARGGFGSMRILPLLDYAVIRRHPKFIVGFSDITALLVAIRYRCGLATYHGPVVTTLGNIDEASRESLSATLTGAPPAERTLRASASLMPGKAAGPLLVGNLTLLCHLIGTPFQPVFKGHILLIEDRAEALYRIDRMLTHLHLAGCLEGIAGLALGSFEDCGAEEDIQRLFGRFLARLRVPALAGLEFGHGIRNLTIPLGLPAEMDGSRKRLVIRAPVSVP
jgi:muramoyltetrapeptide carboxypeptidase